MTFTQKCSDTFDKNKMLALITRISTFLNAKQTRLVGRLENYLHKKRNHAIPIKNFPEKLFRLNLASYKFEVKFYFELIKQIVEDKFIVKIMKSHYQNMKNKPKKMKKTLPKPAVVAKAISRLFKNGKKELALLMITMWITGRRSVDLLRLKKKNLQRINDNLYTASIPKDKKHQSTRHFTIDLTLYEQKWCGIKKEDFGQEWDKLIKASRNEAALFKGVCKASLARAVGTFKPHILRSIRAILLLKRGKTDKQVMDFVGWDDVKSLDRYVKINRSVVGRLSWEEICEGFNCQL